MPSAASTVDGSNCHNDDIGGSSSSSSYKYERSDNNNNNNATSTTTATTSTLRHHQAATPSNSAASTTPFRLSNTAATAAQQSPSTPSTSTTRLSRHNSYLNSLSFDLSLSSTNNSRVASTSSTRALVINNNNNNNIVTSSGNKTSSPYFPLSTSSSVNNLRPARSSGMETPMPHPSTSSSTPRPGSRQSVASGASSATSVSPPNSLQLLSAVVEHAAATAASNGGSGSTTAPMTSASNCSHHQQDAGSHNDSSSSVVADPALELPTFDKPDDVTDLELEVEGRKLYAHRVALVLASPVFRAMLTGDFIERKQSAIQMKDKKHDELLEFLQAIYPPWKPVSSTNVRILLRYADEYRVDGLLRRCEDFLLALKMARDTQEQRLWAYEQGQPFCRVNELLGLANSFNLERLARALVDYLSPRPLAWQMDGPDFFAYSGPELENRILNKALSTALTLIDRNRYCDTVKELLNGHKVYFE